MECNQTKQPVDIYSRLAHLILILFQVELYSAIQLRWQENIKSPTYFTNCKASEEDVDASMALAGITNANLVKGWFEDTLPSASFPNGIALLRMDADWYKSTYQILASLFPFVNKDGLILIDDYYTWDGCSKAVHDYLSVHKRPERISSYKGVCYIVKKKDEVFSK